MSIWVFGDTHGDLEINKISTSKFPEAKALSEKDYIVICGDFGFPFLSCETEESSAWSPIESIRSARKSYLYWMRWMASKPFSILFVAGNHENHDYWDSIPKELWHGGYIKRSPDAPNVLNLVSGEYFEIDGYTIWAFGGAVSIDRNMRIAGRDWWPQEVPSVKEMQHGMEVLAEHEFKADIILTHTLPRSQIIKCGINRIFNDPVSSYLDEVFEKVQFKNWYCGHFHIDKTIQTTKGIIRVLYQSHLNILP